MRITAENTIALVIDIQEKLVPSIYAHKYLVKTTQNLLEALNILNIPKVIAEQYPKGLGSTIPEIAKYFRPEDKVFPKTSFSAVEDENLFQELQNSKKQNVILFGIEAHVCVMQTFVDLREKGYNVILINDCIGSRSKYDKKVALRRAEQEGVLISSYESIVFELTRSAKNPNFKAISDLIKKSGEEMEKDKKHKHKHHEHHDKHDKHED